MENLPSYISIVFILSVALTVLLFYKASNNSKRFFIIVIAWLSLQGLIALKDFYSTVNVHPQRFMLLLFPPLLLIGALFFTAKGKVFIDNLNIKTLTLLHIIRIPVELVLLLLFYNKMIPGVMTFEGMNFDILSGITAPFVFYFGFKNQQVNRKLLMAWNIVCLLLLFNIIRIAVLSAPLPFQQFGFEQPNIAILYFPYNWLPCCIVPIVLLSHLASIRQLLNKVKK